MQTTRFRGFKLYFENRQATESMLRAIEDFPAGFDLPGERPWVIDAGSNIGISMLEWKSRWPMARITCFEPDPNAFRLLQLNVIKNDLPGVECFPLALADFQGDAPFYGRLEPGDDSRGNSICSQWGRRKDTSVTKVQCTRLSTIIKDRPVAFLKLDIEGAEQIVLEDIQSKLSAISMIYVEVHETDQSVQRNSTQRIIELLDASGFQHQVFPRHGPRALPAFLEPWRVRVGARQAQIFATRDVPSI